MQRLLPVAIAIILAVAIGVPTLAQNEVTQERIDEIAAMLPAEPAGVGAPISDRAAWDALAARPEAKSAVERAEKLLGETIPEQPDDLYLDFSKTGNRTRWQRVSGQRRGRINTLVLAECLENKGRFLPAFEEVLAAICAEKCWVMPAHDRSLANFEGKTIEIDLASASLGWNLATADYWLGENLSPGSRTLLRESVRKFVLDPYRAMVKGEGRRNWWMATTNNWNAVCLAGVTGAGLALLADPADRALFVGGAEHFSKNFLRGFTSDGYCSEGTGYWNYGFGYYVHLAETIRQATDGGVDLFGIETVEAPARYGTRIEVIGGVCPAFADCGVTARPSSRIMQFVNRIYGLGLPEYAELNQAMSGSLYEVGIYSFPNSASETEAVEGEGGQALRDWFDQAGILISRPGGEGTARMGVALKGGHNAEHHNHNDVGSFVVVVGKRPVLLDPGSEVYTARTFSSKRYESNVLNSWGHPVPVVAGALQKTGKNARGQVIQSDLTDTTDTLMLDLSSAYDVPELKKLDRTFVYSREGDGSLTVTDEVAFETPQTFGTALITLGEWRDLGEGELFVFDYDEAVRVKIEASGAVAVTDEEIKEDSHGDPIRIGIDFVEPLTEATITVTVTPAELPGDGAALLRNGGFELGKFGWDLLRDNMGEVTNEQAASGEYSLKITDAEKTTGSNIYSAPFPVEPGQAHALKGKVFGVSGGGVGMYVRYYDEAGEEITEMDERGYVPSIGGVGDDSKEWKEFSFPFTPPEGTVTTRVWIHSANAAAVEAYLDDIEVVKGG